MTNELNATISNSSPGGGVPVAEAMYNAPSKITIQLHAI